MKTIRILVFGATGTGKTSLCNVLTGRVRPTDSGARGVTAKSYAYPAFVASGRKIVIVDTVGLHESDHGTIPADQAILALVDLLEKARDGFSLLIQVTRASRITKEHDDDYSFFVEKMTQRTIPAVLAITGCENEQPMDAWVRKNHDAFSRYGYLALVPTCFASGGKFEKVYAALRKRSREELLRAILAHALPEPSKLYGNGTGSTFSEALTRIWNEFVTMAGLPDKYRRRLNESAYALMTRLGVSKTLADTAVAHIPDLLGELGNKLPFPGAGKILRGISKWLLEKIAARTPSK